MKPDRTAPRTPIDLNGRKFLLVLDFNAISAFEDQTGKKFNQLNFQDLGVKDMHALLWASMQTEHPEVSFRDVGSWVGFHNLQHVGEKIAAVLKVSAPSAKDSDGPLAEEEAVTASTG